MKRLISWMVGFALVGLSAQIASADGCGTGGIPLGDIYLSFEPDVYDRYKGTEIISGGDPSDTEVGAFSPFHFYLLVHVDYCDCGDCELNTGLGFEAWEAQLDLSRVAPGDLTIISAQLSPEGSTNSATPVKSNFLVDTGGSCATADSLVAVVTFQALISNPLGASDLRIDLMAAEPSDAVSPGWSQCGSGGETQYTFVSVEDGDPRVGYQRNFIILNPTWGPYDPVESANFGAVKARYSLEP